MSDKPILFSGPMVRAILEGSKTQTRRLISIRGHQAITDFGPSDTAGYDWRFRDAKMLWHDLRHAELMPRLPYALGDRLWVRERHQFRGADYGEGEIEWFRLYGSDGATDSWDPCFPDGWEPTGSIRILSDTDEQEGDGVMGYATTMRPSIHMPRWASRLTLIVEDVRVERLQDTGESDAVAEGVERDSDGWRDYLMPETQCCGHPHDSFRTLWDSLNAKRAPWASNPWVVAVTFRAVQANIDRMEAAE